MCIPENCQFLEADRPKQKWCPLVMKNYGKQQIRFFEQMLESQLEKEVCKSPTVDRFDATGRANSDMA
jgi:hypothetical protein